MRAKHKIGDFEGFFEGAKIFWPPNWLSEVKGNFGVKKDSKTMGGLEF
jgi:hypothetical protein